MCDHACGTALTSFEPPSSAHNNSGKHGLHSLGSACFMSSAGSAAFEQCNPTGRLLSGACAMLLGAAPCQPARSCNCCKEADQGQLSWHTGKAGQRLCIAHEANVALCKAALGPFVALLPIDAACAWLCWWPAARLPRVAGLFLLGGLHEGLSHAHKQPCAEDEGSDGPSALVRQNCLLQS